MLILTFLHYLHKATLCQYKLSVYESVNSHSHTHMCAYKYATHELQKLFTIILTSHDLDFPRG